MINDMNRKNILPLIVALAAIGAAVVTSAVIKRNNGTILNRNVEALMEGEFDPVAICETHCENKSGYVCVLYTNMGFEIYCDDMVPWM